MAERNAEEAKRHGWLQAVGCPMCGRVANSRAELLELGCEGKHEPLVPFSEVEALVEAVRAVVNAPTEPFSRKIWKDLSDALRPFEVLDQ